MNLYNLDRETGALLKSTIDNPNPTQARPDPLVDGEFLVPAHATLIEPPTVTAENSVAVFNGVGWHIEKDYRESRAFEIATGREVIITTIGDVPDGITLLIPPDYYPKWNGSAWEENIDKALADKEKDIEDKCDELQQANFAWNGHTFFADASAQNDFSQTMQRARNMAPSAPVPTPPPITGMWKTAEVDSQSNPMYCYMTVGDLSDLTDALYDKVALLWAKKGIHIATIQAMAKSGKSAKEIVEYDISIGW